MVQELHYLKRRIQNEANNFKEPYMEQICYKKKKEEKSKQTVDEEHWLKYVHEIGAKYDQTCS